MTVPAPTRLRLSREARRAQLLDAAAQLLIDQGAGAVTMERVAEWAGVSKALPYSHFDNSDDVLRALYESAVGELGQRIWRALEIAEAGTDRVALVVRTYLDTVAELGPILAAVTRPGSRPAELADRDGRVGPRFVTAVLTEHFGVPHARAEAAAPILLSALTGAVAAWHDRAGSRAQVEALSVAVMRALVE